jgi:hypothetical protein
MTSTDIERRSLETDFERFKLAALFERAERDPAVLEAAKRADLEKAAKELSKLSGISPGETDYLRVQRMVSEFEEVLDAMIERTLSNRADRLDSGLP